MPKLSFQYVERDWPETLLEFLVRRFRYHDAAQWEQRIQDGYVRVNGHAVSPQRRLSTQDRIVYEPPPTPEPPVDTHYGVLFEDEHLLAVSKSGNMPTSPSGKYWHHCLVHYLKQDRALPELHAVHRLDRETSGINLFAKSQATARRLGTAFSAGEVRKAYGAILRGCLPAREVYVTAPLRNATRGQVRIRQEAHPDGREARTRFRLTALLEGACQVEIDTLTGRTHQIRTHAEYLGCPVWGDKLYGRPEADFIHWVQHGTRDSRNRHLLHSMELEFKHPVTGHQITISDPDTLLLDLFRELTGGS